MPRGVPSVSNPTNWVLQHNPNIYLFGALMESAAFTLDESRIAGYEAQYQMAKKTINTRWWRENGLKADGVILNGTGCAAVLAGTHPLATRPPVHSGYHGESTVKALREEIARLLEEKS